MTTVEPFVSPVQPEALDDLRRRVRATRWPDAPEDAGWSMGTDLAYLQQLADHWADGFDWWAQERTLDRVERLRVRLGDLSVHVLRARADASGPPLLLCHGWPDSSWRYSKVLALLADPGAHGGDPADAFTVVVPDMPGFGWSTIPSVPMDSTQVAELWIQLMDALGHDRFFVAGGDIGSGVARYLALEHPDRVVAVHRMDAGLPPPGTLPADLGDDERTWLADVAAWGAAEGAYAAVHRTKPQTAAFGLTDSPVGLAAWILEKLRAWSDCGGDVESRFTRDEILHLVTAYWLSGTIAASMRMYRANAAIPLDQHRRRVEVPSGFSLFPADILRPPRRWLERTADVRSVTTPPHGGHFAPFEEPELYTGELRSFFAHYRSGISG